MKKIKECQRGGNKGMGQEGLRQKKSEHQMESIRQIIRVGQRAVLLLLD